MLRIAEEEGIWTWKATFPGTHPDWQIVELTVGDSTLDFEPGEVRGLDHPSHRRLIIGPRLDILTDPAY